MGRKQEKRRSRTTNAKRSITFETLQDRKLMAADLGVIYGPILPGIQMPTAEVAQANASATNTNQVSVFRTNQGDLRIVGTSYDDDVTVSLGTNGRAKVTAQTTDDAGNVHAKEVEISSVREIIFDGHDGNDRFRNVTLKKVRATGGDGDDYMTTVGGGTMHGGEGNDTLRGSARSVHLWGEDGNDRLFGSIASDYLNGGDDRDHLYGGSSKDYMFGGSGNDYLRGDRGNDDIYAGGGNDTVRGGGGDDTIYGESGVNRLHGGDDDDTIIGGVHQDFIYGEDGDDVIMGQQGGDHLYGGEGNDRVSGGSGNDIVSGGDGHDELFGNSGYDSLLGGDDRDLLDGGDDMLPDSILGGGGDDIFVRHAALTVFGTDDPDHFKDFSAVDEVFNDYLSPNFGDDFPTRVR